jgi:hypothetical protein
LISRLTTKLPNGPGTTTQAYGSASQFKGRAMDPEADEIACALAEALPRDADRRTELVAVGMLATALIADTVVEERAELVETFCATLRRSVANEMN